jgi:hypothetical protein
MQEESNKIRDLFLLCLHCAAGTRVYLVSLVFFPA